jgi:hypothetical protein
MNDIHYRPGQLINDDMKTEFIILEEHAQESSK